MCSITSSGSTIRIDGIRLLDLLARQSMKELLGYLRTVSGKTGEAQLARFEAGCIGVDAAWCGSAHYQHEALS